MRDETNSEDLSVAGSDDESEDAACEPSVWLPALLSSERLRHVAWRAEAQPELSLLRLSLSSEKAPPAELDDAPGRHVAVAHGPGRFVLYLDAAAPSELLCDVGGLPPCLWVPIGSDEEEVAAALSQLAALYPFAAKAQPVKAIWAARPPATTSPSPSSLLPRLFVGGRSDDDGAQAATSAAAASNLGTASSLCMLFDSLLGTSLAVSADTPAEVRAAESCCSATELLEVELRCVHSGKALWLHALNGLCALSAQPATLRSEHVCAEAVEGVNAELGTCFDDRMPLDAIAALLAAGVQCIGPAQLRAALMPSSAPAAAAAASAMGADGSSAAGSTAGGVEESDAHAASALHVLHFLRAPGLLDDLRAAAVHRSASVRGAAAAVAAQLGALPGVEAQGAVELLESMADNEVEPSVLEVVANAREHIAAARAAAAGDLPQTRAAGAGAASSAGSQREKKKRQRSGRNR